MEDVLDIVDEQPCAVAKLTLATGRPASRLPNRTIEFRSKVACTLDAPGAVERHFLEATQVAKRIEGKKQPKSNEE
jgi:hypothetical protein